MSKDLVDESRAAMLHDNMDLSNFIVHAQQVEESLLRKRNSEDKKEKSFESGSPKSRLAVQ